MTTGPRESNFPEKEDKNRTKASKLKLHNYKHCTNQPKEAAIRDWIANIACGLKISTAVLIQRCNLSGRLLGFQTSLYVHDYKSF